MDGVTPESIRVQLRRCIAVNAQQRISMMIEVEGVCEEKAKGGSTIGACLQCQPVKSEPIRAPRIFPTDSTEDAECACIPIQLQRQLQRPQIDRFSQLKPPHLPDPFSPIFATGIGLASSSHYPDSSFKFSDRCLDSTVMTCSLAQRTRQPINA